MTQADVSRITSGYVINLIAGDLQRFEHVVTHFLLFLHALLTLCGVAFLMVYLVGWEPLTGLILFAILSLYYGAMGGACAQLRTKISVLSDKRVNTMNSIISGIRTVKMYAWEEPFMERVQRIRR